MDKYSVMKNLWTLSYSVAFYYVCLRRRMEPRSLLFPLPFLNIRKHCPASRSYCRKEDTLQKQFAAKKAVWPAKYIYIRSFKYDSQLEVWVKNDLKILSSFSKLIRSVLWRERWAQKEWQEISRYLKAFITSMNSTLRAITIFHSDSTTRMFLTGY
jgi:murein L,D-transpeptidase YafK